MGSSLTGSYLWVHAGWTMLHYFWVGTLLGLGAWACHWGLRSASAGARYVVALGCLGALAVAPIAIAVGIDVPPGLERPSTTPEPTRAGAGEYPAGPAIAAALEAGPAEQESVCAGGLPAGGSPWYALVTLLPWLWLLGSPSTLAWSLAGLAGAERLRRLSSPTGDRQLDALCRRLTRSLKISRDVSIRLCSRIAVPVLVGIVRPMILLPPSLLAGLTPRQLEMILVHELAHVRRYDNLVNLAQRMIESALFFHPAVWLVSRWVRQEREHCCDEAVVRRLGDRVSYAGTLLVVVRQGLLANRAALPVRAAGGAVSSVANSHLRTRVYRILGREEETMQISRKLGAVVPAVLLTAVVLAGALGLSTGRAEPSEDSHPAGQREAEPDDPERGVSQDQNVGADPPVLDVSTPPQRVEEEAETNPRAQGAVRWVDQRNEAVWISLGRKDGLEKGTEFRVYGQGKADARLGNEKGVIVVTRILQDHLAEARIDRDSPSDPIKPGDRVHSPDWKGQRKAVVTARISVDGKRAESPGELRRQLTSLRNELLALARERAALSDKMLELTHQLQKLTTEQEKLMEAIDRAEGSEKAEPSHGTLWPKLLVPGLKVDGVVLDVGADRLIEISIGYDDGLRKGQGLLAYRPGRPTTIPLGGVEVVEARPDRAVCRILSEFPHKPIQKGDRVGTTLPGSGVTGPFAGTGFPAEGGAAVSPPSQQADAPVSETLGTDDDAVRIAASRVQISLDLSPDDLSAKRVLEVVDACSKMGIPVLNITIPSDAEDSAPPPTPGAETGRRSEAKADTEKPVSETLRIGAAGAIGAHGQKLTSDALRDVLDAVKRGQVHARLTIAGDRDDQKKVVEVLKACANAGIIVERVTLQGDAADSGPSAATAGPEPVAPED